MLCWADASEQKQGSSTRGVKIILLLSSEQLAWFAKRPLHEKCHFSVQIIGTLADEGLPKNSRPRLSPLVIVFCQVQQQSSLLTLCVTKDLSLYHMPQECQRSTLIRAHISAPRARVDSSCSRLSSLYPAGRSETAPGLFGGRTRFWVVLQTLSLPVMVMVMSAAVCQACFHVWLGWRARCHGPVSELWPISWTNG